eukprot:g1717.t1
MEAMKKEHANDMAKLAAELEASQADLKHKEEMTLNAAAEHERSTAAAIERLEEEHAETIAQMVVKQEESQRLLQETRALLAKARTKESEQENPKSGDLSKEYDVIEYERTSKSSAVVLAREPETHQNLAKQATLDDESHSSASQKFDPPEMISQEEEWKKQIEIAENLLNEEKRLHEETKKSLEEALDKEKRLNVETQKALKESLFFQAASEARMKDTERALKEDYVALKAESAKTAEDLTEKLLRLEALRKQDVETHASELAAFERYKSQHQDDIENMQKAQKALLVKQYKMMEERMKEKDLQSKQHATSDGDAAPASIESVQNAARRDRKRINKELTKMMVKADAQKKALSEWRHRAKAAESRAEAAELKAKNARDAVMRVAKDHMGKVMRQSAEKYKREMDELKDTEQKRRANLQHEYEVKTSSLRVELERCKVEAEERCEKLATELKRLRYQTESDKLDEAVAAEKLEEGATEVAVFSTAPKITVSPPKGAHEEGKKQGRTTPLSKMLEQVATAREEREEGENVASDSSTISKNGRVSMLEELRSAARKAEVKVEAARRVMKLVKAGDAHQYQKAERNLQLAEGEEVSAQNGLSVYLRAQKLYNNRINTLLSEVDRLKEPVKKRIIE